MKTAVEQNTSAIPDALTNHLEMHPDAMRAMGYAVVDAIVDQATSLPDQPTVRSADREMMDGFLWEAAPQTATPAREVLNRVLSEITPFGHRNSHPRYFGYVPNPSNFVGAMADALVSGFNTFSGMWIGSPGAAETELVVTDWLRGWCGLPETGGGILMSGSSMATLSALVAARQATFAADGDAARQGTIYYSDQAHSSVAKGARTIGIMNDRQRMIPTDQRFRMDLAALTDQIAKDKAAGLTPFCIVAAAGTTNTAAVDPLAEIAAICRERNIWMHVDGAFAAATMLTAKGKTALAGIEHADSIALDGHKWLFQPIECGALLVRDIETLRNAFHVRPEYLKDAESAEGEVQFCDLGPQLTRNFRALKLWMTVQTFGVAAIERGMILAEQAERELAAAGWEIVTEAQLGVLTFSCPGQSERNLDVLHIALEEGYLALSTTVLEGRTVLRMCVTNPRISDAEMSESVRRLTTYRDRL